MGNFFGFAIFVSIMAYAIIILLPKILNSLEESNDMKLRILRLVIRKEDGYAIQHIANPNEELQRLAVQQNGGAIQFINNPSEKIQLEAIKKSPWVIKFIDNPSEKLQKLAIKKSVLNLADIKNPSDKVIKWALKTNRIQHTSYRNAIKNHSNPVS